MPTSSTDVCTVVGYYNKEMVAGHNATGVSFINTTGEPIDMTQVIMTGYNKETYEGASITVQKLNADGSGTTGTYLEWYDDELGMTWYNTSTSQDLQPGEILLNPGDGLWLEAPSSDVKLVSSGEVITKGADVTLRAGQTLVCNPVPVAVSFDNTTPGGKFLAPTGYNRETYEPASIIVQQLNPDGTGKTGTYFEWYDDELGATWYDTSTSGDVSGKSLEPGVAIWTTANSTQEKISFPAL